MRVVCVLTKISLRFPSSSIFVSKVDTCDIVSVDSIENGLCTNDTEDALAIENQDCINDVFRFPGIYKYFEPA